MASTSDDALVGLYDLGFTRPSLHHRDIHLESNLISRLLPSSGAEKPFCLR